LCHYPYVEQALLPLKPDAVLVFEDDHLQYCHTLFSAPLDEVLKAHHRYPDQRRFLLQYYGTCLNSLEQTNPQAHRLEAFLKKALKRLTWRQPRPEGTLKDRWLIHGHIHGLWQTKPLEKMINVSVEVWDLKPVSEQDLVTLILKNP
jgi:hypothetical protein